MMLRLKEKKKTDDLFQKSFLPFFPLKYRYLCFAFQDCDSAIPATWPRKRLKQQQQVDEDLL